MKKNLKIPQEVKYKAKKKTSAPVNQEAAGFIVAAMEKQMGMMQSFMQEIMKVINGKQIASPDISKKPAPDHSVALAAKAMESMATSIRDGLAQNNTWEFEILRDKNHFISSVVAKRKPEKPRIEIEIVDEERSL